MIETDETLQIRRDAQVVAEFLRTSYSAKKHGGYNHYEDERIHVSVDTYVPNIDIVLKDVGLVFSASYFHGMISEYYPGAWVTYLHELTDRAIEVRKAQTKEREEREAAERAKRFGPVDDSAIFAGCQEAMNR